jgi:CubicO group peptidase (beta-lactamase class C family)/D-alanyl-D-alanine dipeptidase
VPGVVAGVLAPEGRYEGRYAGLAAHLCEVIEWELRDKEIPGLSIALVDDRQVVWAQGFGLADPATGTAASARTVYRVGSVSKLFTDIGVMQLVERGEVDLDVPVTTYLPDFAPQNPFGRQVTLRQLMAHRSGLVREPPVGHYFDASEPTLAATVASLDGTRLVYEPESRTKYSNAAIAVVGYVLEVLSGEPFADYLERSVLEPVGMKRSAFAPDEAIRSELASAVMWSYDGRRFPAPTWELGMAPAGSLYAPVTDLAEFMKMLLADGRGPDGPVLRPETLRRMLEPQFADGGEQGGFGLGFAIDDLDGHATYGHGGAIYGFATSLKVLPAERLGAVAVANLDAVNSVTERIVDRALRGMLEVRSLHSPSTPLRFPLGSPSIRSAHSGSLGVTQGRSGSVGTTEEGSARSGSAGMTSEGTGPVDRELAERLEGRYRGGDLTVDLFAFRDELVLEGSRGRHPVRSIGGALVLDGRLVDRQPISTTEDGGLLLGDLELRPVAAGRPAPSPERFAGLLGEYGWDHNVLFVYEKDGRLHTLVEWIEIDPMTEVEGAAEPTFEFPERGLYHGERLVFRLGEDGRAREAVMAGIAFPRREIQGETVDTFRIEPVRPVEELRREALAASPPAEPGDFVESDLVELTALDPTIRLDIRYATTSNFMGERFYREPRAFMQRPAAEAVVRAHRALAPLGYGLLIHDAYRPWFVTRMFWDATPEAQRDFVADPALGSRHNRGCAVDLTLFDRATGKPVEMVGLYDEFSARSYPEYMGGTSLQRWHRELLRDAMEAEGFRVYEYEWWHFDFDGWERYRIGNQVFEQIEAAGGAARLD